MQHIKPKQAKFVEEYLVDFNATQAAIRAGYSRRRASEIGLQLLRKPHVQEVLSERARQLVAEADITPERVIADWRPSPSPIWMITRSGPMMA